MRRTHPRWLGAFACGVLATGVGHVAMASDAHADDPVTDILTDISGSINAGETELVIAASDLSSGDLPDSLAFAVAGVDNLLVAPGEDVLVNGTDALLGDPEAGGFDFGAFPAPMDLTDTLTEVQGVLQTAATDFGDTASAVLTGDLAAGLLSGTETADLLFLAAPAVSFVGLADVLLGL